MRITHVLLEEPRLGEAAVRLGSLHFLLILKAAAARVESKPLAFARALGTKALDETAPPVAV